MVTRRNMIATALAAPALLAAKLKGSAAVPPQAATIRPVKQIELQALIDLKNALEVGAANIRRRLEAGAPLEHGRLGAHTCGMRSLEWFEQNSLIGERDAIDDICGLNIEPLPDMQHAIGLVQKYQNPGDAYWV